MKKLIAVFILIVLTVLIETSLVSNMYFLPALPDIMLIVLIFLSIKNGPVSGEVVGFSSGLAIDFLTASPFGLNALLRTIIGYICGLLRVTVDTSGVFIPAMLAFIATLVKALFTFIVSFFFPGSIVLYSIFTSTLWIECVINAILAPCVFFILSCFKVFSTLHVAESYK